MTHDHLLSTTVVGHLQDRRIEIVEVDFSLKGDLVIGVENIEGEGCLRSPEGRGVPADAQKLAIVLNPLGIPCACAELHVDTVNSVIVYHNDDSGCGTRRRARCVLVANIKTVI